MNFILPFKRQKGKMMRHGSVQYDGIGVSYIFLNKITLSFFLGH